MIFELIPADARVVAFIGVARNAGKTTAMVDALRDIEEAGLVPAVLSVGIDGERRDTVSGGDKPSIRVSPETLVATSSQAIRVSSAAVDVLGTTGIRTPMGEVVIGRVRRRGDIMLAGVRHRTDVRALIAALRDEGADRVLVDGAFDRFAAADPDTADAVVLATGMVLGGAVDHVASVTREWIVTLGTPAVPAELRPPAGAGETVWLRRGGVWEDTGAPSLLGLAAFAGPAVDAVFGPGLVSDSVLARLVGVLPPGAVLVVRDPTRVVASWSARARFERRRRIAALRPVRLAAITVNPRRPTGTSVDATELIDAVAAVAGGVPVVDVRSGARR